MKSFLAKLSLLGFSSLLCLLLAEVVFRFLPAAEGFLLIQKRSFPERIAEFEENRPYELSMIAVGDSMLELGEAQNSSFVDVVENLAAKDSLDLGVLNLGEGGTGIGAYQNVLSAVLPEVRTDYVLVSVYLGNDLLDAVVYEKGGSGYLPGSEAEAEALRVARKAALNAPANVSLRARVVASIKQNLSVLRFLYRLGKTFVPQLQSGFLQQTTNRLRGVFNTDDAVIEARKSKLPESLKQPYQGDVLNPWDLALALVRPQIFEETLFLRETAGMPAALRDVLEHVDSMHRISREQNSRMLVVLLPSALTVSESAQEYHKSLGYHVDPAWLQGEFPLTQQFAAALEARGIPYLYPIEELRESARKEELYLPRDIHHNVTGNKVLGMAVYEFLKVQLRSTGSSQLN